MLNATAHDQHFQNNIKRFAHDGLGLHLRSCPCLDDERVISAWCVRARQDASFECDPDPTMQDQRETSLLRAKRIYGASLHSRRVSGFGETMLGLVSSDEIQLVVACEPSTQLHCHALAPPVFVAKCSSSRLPLLALSPRRAYHVGLLWMRPSKAIVPQKDTAPAQRCWMQQPICAGGTCFETVKLTSDTCETP